MPRRVDCVIYADSMEYMIVWYNIEPWWTAGGSHGRLAAGSRGERTGRGVPVAQPLYRHTQHPGRRGTTVKQPRPRSRGVTVKVKAKLKYAQYPGRQGNLISIDGINVLLDEEILVCLG
jgi:hypothetical protein